MCGRNIEVCGTAKPPSAIIALSDELVYVRFGCVLPPCRDSFAGKQSRVVVAVDEIALDAPNDPSSVRYHGNPSATNPPLQVCRFTPTSTSAELHCRKGSIKRLIVNVQL